MINSFKSVIIEIMQQKSLGRFILQQRKNLMPNMSLNTFALDIGIEPATLSRIERGLQKISLTEIGKIANGFNIKASELIKEYELNF